MCLFVCCVPGGSVCLMSVGGCFARRRRAGVKTLLATAVLCEHTNNTGTCKLRDLDSQIRNTYRYSRTAAVVQLYIMPTSTTISTSGTCTPSIPRRRHGSPSWTWLQTILDRCGRPQSNKRDRGESRGDGSAECTRPVNADPGSLRPGQS